MAFVPANKPFTNVVKIDVQAFIPRVHACSYAGIACGEAGL